MLYNICCFTRITLSHEIKGGMEVHTRVLSEELVRRGHRVTILTTSLEPMKELVQNEDGVEVHYLPVSDPAKYSKEFFDLTAKRFEKLHDQRPFDVIWSESAGALGYVKKMVKKVKVPMFMKLQGSHIGNMITSYRAAGNFKKGVVTVLRNLPNTLRQYMNWYVPLIMNCQMVICPSPQTAAEIKRDTLIRKSKIYVSINGVDTNKFYPDFSMRKKGRNILGLDKNSFLLLNVGRLTSDKGVDILIRAIAELVPKYPYLTVAIVGIGNESEKLEYLSKQLGVANHIRFLGFIPNEKLPEYYNACDLFVCPTVRVESFGIVIAEAMACGKPVICSASGGTKYVVEDQISGLFVPVKKVDMLANNITKILSNPNLSSELGTQARHRAINHLSLIKMAEDTEYVMNKIIE